jgi:hypothetical protein
MTEKAHTHGAFSLRRETRSRSRWIEIGRATIETGRCAKCGGEVKDAGVHEVVLDRLPTGGFTGHVTLSPTGAKLPDPDSKPVRPEEIDT